MARSACTRDDRGSIPRCAEAYRGYGLEVFVARVKARSACTWDAQGSSSLSILPPPGLSGSTEY